MTQQAFWNDIKLESKGPEAPSGGYAYRDLLDVWSAANATKSPVIMRWWQPEANQQSFEGTDAEFVPISLPAPTEICRKNRVSNDDRCSEDIFARRGNMEGSCADELSVMRRVIVQALGDHTFLTPPGERSPAYDGIKNMRVSDISMDAMMRRWISRKVDKYGFDPREAVCSWAAENVDILSSAIPRGYPRVVQENEWYAPVMYAGATLSAIMLLATLLVASLVYKHREKRSVKVAQLDFLAIILSGILALAVGAVVYILPPSPATCISKQWLLTLGYTLSITPLLVKVAAINKIMQGAKRLKRIKLTRRQLLRQVASVVIGVTLFLIIWTAVDAPQSQETIILVNESGNLVERQESCASSSVVWFYAILTWNFILLICASVLAIQSRNVRQEFNESKFLGLLVYARFFFVILGAIVYFLSENNDSLAPNVFAGIISLLLSFDVAAALLIYFVPKLYAKQEIPNHTVTFTIASENHQSGIISSSFPANNSSHFLSSSSQELSSQRESSEVVQESSNNDAATGAEEPMASGAP